MPFFTSLPTALIRNFISSNCYVEFLEQMLSFRAKFIKLKSGQIHRHLNNVSLKLVELDFFIIEGQLT